MERRRVAGSCALLAATLGILTASSEVTPISIEIVQTDHDAAFLHFFDGRARMFWFHSADEAIQAESDVWSGVIHVRSKHRRAVPPPADQHGPPAPPAFSVPIRIANRHQVPFLGGRWRGEVTNRPPPPFDLNRAVWSFESSFIRVPAWPMVVVLMIPPIRRSISERRRRRRAGRNECQECGYSLIALVEPRCPECGTPTPVPSLSA